ncbi:MAG: galactokinase [Ignavibacteriales bacterium]|nr:galactokinase [Ignavibacteriales bacterium]
MEKYKNKFIELFTNEPLMVRSPGRINLIGEHTDYNDGFVLPAAIDKSIYFAIAPSGKDSCHLYAYDLNEEYKFKINSYAKITGGWQNYLLGVIDQFKKLYLAIDGFNCVFGGDIPIGSGMSSSAAVEAGLAFALNNIFKLNLNKLELTKLAQRAENEFVGVRCGIMDQFANLFGQKDKVLKLDCRTLEFELIPLELKKYSILLIDTKVKHSLASSEYNLRRAQCEESVKYFAKFDNSIKSLRDVNLELIMEHKDKLESVLFKSAFFVVSENKRLLDGCNDLMNGNIDAFGEKMFATHYGLKNDYEVSCPELDYLVEMAEQFNGVVGSRLMGGGFGGCTINLVETNKIEEFKEIILRSYFKKFNIKPQFYSVSITNGTELI